MLTFCEGGVVKSRHELSDDFTHLKRLAEVLLRMKKMKSWLATILSVAMGFSFTVAPGISAVAAETDNAEGVEIEMYAGISEDENSDVIVAAETAETPETEDVIEESAGAEIYSEADTEGISESVMDITEPEPVYAEEAAGVEGSDEETALEDADPEEGEPDADEAESEEEEEEDDGILLLSILDSVPYVDANGASYIANGVTEVEGDVTTWSDGWYVVDSDVEISSRITVSGMVNLILADDCTLTASNGIDVNSGNTLNIYVQSGGTGKLTATGTGEGAGIGGGSRDDAGTITINGGTVTATGSNNGGAGIGGGRLGDGGTITINGGTVTAFGATYAAGIGGGWSGSGGSININGGTVTATSGANAAGIGGGYTGSGGTITINGGKVTATNTGEAAGIGGGYWYGSGGTITITGGEVIATGGSGGAGIGGGHYGTGGTIKIQGGMVTATATSNRGAGIGGGYEARAETIEITGGTVIASGYNGIGSGTSSGATTTNIANCIIYANSIQDLDSSKHSGIIYTGTGNGPATVYGSPVFSTDVCIPEGKTAQIEDGKTVTIASGATLTNYGTLYQDWGSTFIKYGTYTDNGRTYYEVASDIDGDSFSLTIDGVTEYSDRNYAEYGTQINIAVSDGYASKDLTVEKNSEGTVTVSDGGFTMPEDPVKITAAVKKMITEDMFEVNTDPETYTGSEITKAISGSDDGNELTEGSDYTVSYEDNEDVGMATITIEGTGDYTGTLTYTFTINPAEITEDMFSVDTTSETYNGEKFEKDISGKYGDMAMSEGTDYTVSYEDNMHAGTATITITGEGNYTGMLEYEFTILQAEQSISYGETQIDKFDYDDPFTNELTENLVYGDVTYSFTTLMGDEPVIEIDEGNGEVTIKNPGVVRVTAKASGSDDYEEAAASYILTVNSDEISVKIEVNNDDVDYDEGTGEYTDELTYDGEDIELEIVLGFDEDEEIHLTLNDITSQWYDYDPDTGTLRLIDGATGDTYTLTGDAVGAGDYVYLCVSAVIYDNGYKHIVYGVIEIKIDQAEQSISYEETELTKTTADNDFTNPLTQNVVSGDDGAGITYVSSDPSVATVDPLTGTVHVLSAGETTITATAAGTGNYTAAEAVYNLTVTEAVLSVTITSDMEGDDNTKTYDGEPVILTASPDTDYSNVSFTYQWYSPDGSPINGANGASYTLSGDVADSGTYSCIVGAIYSNGNSGSVTGEITVTIEKADQTLAFAEDSVEKGTLDAPFTNELTGAQGSVTYTSSDESVAVVDADTGEVTIVSFGEAAITATAEETENYNGGATASYDITVTCDHLYSDEKDGNGNSVYITTDWSEDGAECPFTFACTVCGEKVEVDGTVTDEVTLEPGCTTEGTDHFTADASVESADGTTVTAESEMDIAIPALGHDWEWSDEIVSEGDTTTTRVYFTCTRCGAEVEEDIIVETGSEGIEVHTDLNWNDVFSADDLAELFERYADGEEIDIVLGIEALDREEAPEEDVRLIEDVVGQIWNESDIFYMDISLILTVTHNEDVIIDEAVTETNLPVTFTVTIPDKLLDAEGNSYIVIRIHDGAAEILPVTDNGDGTLTFMSDKFSTYAIAKGYMAYDLTAQINGGENITKTYDGSSVELTVETAIDPEVDGEVIYTYQWYLDGSAVEGADGSSLILSGSAADSGIYSCFVTATLEDGTVIMATSDGITVTISKAEQTPAFSDGSTVTKTENDEPFTNPLTDAYGDVTYTSSDESVAIVDADGTVTIIGPGTAIITATIAGDEDHEGTEISYTLTVTADDGSGGSKRDEITEPGPVIQNEGTGTTGTTGGTGTDGTGSGTDGTGTTGANTADTNAPILYGILVALAGAAIVTLGVRRRVIRR